MKIKNIFYWYKDSEVNEFDFLEKWVDNLTDSDANNFPVFL